MKTFPILLVLLFLSFTSCQNHPKFFISNGTGEDITNLVNPSLKGFKLVSPDLTVTKSGKFVWKADFGNLAYSGKSNEWLFFLSVMKSDSESGRLKFLKVSDGALSAVKIRYYIRDSTGKIIVELKSTLGDWNEGFEIQRNSLNYVQIDRIKEELKNGNVIFIAGKDMRYSLFFEMDVSDVGSEFSNSMAIIELKAGGTN